MARIHHGSVRHVTIDSRPEDLNPELAERLARILNVSVSRLKEYLLRAHQWIRDAITDTEIPSLMISAPSVCKGYRKRNLEITFNRNMHAMTVLGVPRDIFVVADISEGSLAHFLRGGQLSEQVAPSSTVHQHFRQIHNIRFFTAAECFDFCKFKEKFPNNNVHHFVFNQRQNCLIWKQSSGSIANLSSHLMAGWNNNYSGIKQEKKLIRGSKVIPYDTKRITCIVGEYGTGKTMLLAEIYKYFTGKSNQRVVYAHIGDLLNDDATPVRGPYTNFLTKIYLDLHRKHITNLLIDCFDELDGSTAFGKSMQNLMLRFPKARFWIAIRPELVEEMGNYVPKIVCKLEPLRREQQIEYLCEKLKLHTDLLNKTLKKYTTDLLLNVSEECGEEFVSCPIFLSSIYKALSSTSILAEIKSHSNDCPTIGNTRRWSKLFTFYIVAQIHEDVLNECCKIFIQRHRREAGTNSSHILDELENIAVQALEPMLNLPRAEILTPDNRGKLGILESLFGKFDKSLCIYLAALKVIDILVHWEPYGENGKIIVKYFLWCEDILYNGLPCFTFVNIGVMMFVEVILRFHPDIQISKSYVEGALFVGAERVRKLAMTVQACIFSDLELIYLNFFQDMVNESNTDVIITPQTVKLATSLSSASLFQDLFQKLPRSSRVTIEYSQNLLFIAVQKGDIGIVQILTAYEEICNGIRMDNSNYYTRMIRECKRHKNVSKYETIHEMLYNIKYSQGNQYREYRTIRIIGVIERIRRLVGS